jgi:hypothetical protein
LIVGLWVVVIAEAVLLGVIVARSGGLVELLRWKRKESWDASKLISKRLPELRVAPVSAGGAASGTRGVVFEQSSIVVFVKTNCVASYRLLRYLTGRLDNAPADFPVIFAFVGAAHGMGRLLQQFRVSGRSIEVADRRFSARIADALPLAVSVGENNLVGHAESIESESEFETFIGACGSADIRHWYSSATVDLVTATQQ